MKKTGFILLAILLAGCGNNAVTQAPSGPVGGTFQQQGIIQQIQQINAQHNALASQDLTSDPSDIPSSVPQDVYIDILPGDVGVSATDITLDSLYVGEFTRDQPLDEIQVAAAVEKYTVSRPDVYKPSVSAMGVSGTLQAQQNFFGVRLCERRVDQPHVSGTQAVRGKLIVKGVITCPATPYTYQVRATLQLERKETGYYTFFGPYNSPNPFSFLMLPNKPIVINDYQYYSVAPCTDGNYRGRSEASYIGGPQGRQYTFQPTKYGQPRLVKC